MMNLFLNIELFPARIRRIEIDNFQICRFNDQPCLACANKSTDPELAGNKLERSDVQYDTAMATETTLVTISNSNWQSRFKVFKFQTIFLLGVCPFYAKGAKKGQTFF